MFFESTPRSKSNENALNVLLLEKNLKLNFFDARETKGWNYLYNDSLIESHRGFKIFFMLMTGAEAEQHFAP
jgi:hypothetical protein